MANSLITCSLVAKESLAVLENQLTFASMVNRDFKAEFSGNMARGYAPGNTINIKRPPRYTYRTGRVAAPQATTETTAIKREVPSLEFVPYSGSANGTFTCTGPGTGSNVA